MKHFRLLTKTRQETEYSCGANALQAVLSYWGRDVEEAELMKLLHTSSEVGTYPEDIARVARALGFEAEVRENLTLDEVKKFTANGAPMIGLAQVWLSQKESRTSAEEEWDNGHWIVVLGVDEKYVYFQDPYARMSKAFIPRKAFEAHWHQAMGGDLTRSPKLIHLGIFIRGKKPAERDVAAEMNLSTLDFRKLGSLNLMVMQFAGYLYFYDFVTEVKDILKDILDSGNVRPDAFFFLRKDKEGNISGMEGSRLDEAEDTAAVNAVVAALASRSVGRPDLSRSKAEAAIRAAAKGDFGLSPDDIESIAQKLPPNHSAVIAIFENVWERKLKDVAKKYQGGVINQRLISPEGLAKAASELVAAGKPASA